MAILGQIRQRSFFLILVIGMALFAFVISGVFTNNAGNNNPTGPIALINDEEVDVDLFRFNVDQAERTYNYSRLQAVSLVWDQTIRNSILNQEFDILGIDAGKAQLEQIISSNDSFLNDTRFLNESGFFDFGLFTNFLVDLRTNNPESYENWKLQEQKIISIAKERIYLDLIKSSAGFTEVEGKAAYHIENDKISIEYLQLPFNIIEDSLVFVSDNEIKKYISDNSDQYKRDETRSLRFVFFPEVATDQDISDQRNELELIINDRIEYNDVSKLTDTIVGFKNTFDILDFVDQYSAIPFDSVYQPKGSLSSEYAEIIFNLKTGDVFGPYKDGDNLKLTRFMDRKKGGSLRASHLLIAYKGATGSTNQVTRSKEQAKQKAKKLYSQIRNNPNIFENLVRENSDGPSKSLGGDLGFFQEGYMAKEFFNFVNKNRIGKVGLVETEFGFHIIKITDKEDIVLTANIIQPIIPSENTANSVFKTATTFEMEAIQSNPEKFKSIAEDKKNEVQEVMYVNALDENLPGLFEQRPIVQWAFDDETELGDIRKFSISSGGYAVVQLTKIRDDGIAQIEEVRFEISERLKNQKKAELIEKKYKNFKNLELLSEASNQEIQSASALTQINAVIAGAGQEPYIIGAAFALDINQTSELITGQNGLYMIRLLNKDLAIDLANYSAYSNTLKNAENNRINTAIYDALKSSASIEDNRSLYY
ncbi:MAG: peptidylprolyl isomerase [Flavobacteriaceae bacterium]|nr:peptidylprolyl isomerase [Flavobacteriaceae bacterium]|tara:strand:+ start:11368 stop:13488 length:2121 start_codon:yes stop_codon:yes gene_type:complete